jgi:hypothetical protein
MENQWEYQRRSIKILEFEGEEAYWWLIQMEEYLAATVITETEHLLSAVKGLRSGAYH